jgi:hypothetical protein
MKRLFVLVFVLLGFFAVITQFKLMMDNRVASIPETIVRFFSFFTILTNILVAMYFSCELFKVENQWFNVRNKAHILTAVAVYITVVGLVYQILLRHIWNPTGLQRVVDELLHSVIPALAVVYWILFENKSTLKWSMIPKWLIYPLVYLIYIILRGNISGFYPYPFVDVAAHGLKQVLINSFFMTLLFLVLSLVLVFVGKRIHSRV